MFCRIALLAICSLLEHIQHLQCLYVIISKLGSWHMKSKMSYQHGSLSCYKATGLSSVNKNGWARKYMEVWKTGSVYFRQCDSVTMCLQVFKMASFDMHKQSGPFLHAYKNGQVRHHAGSTSDGVCGGEYLLRVQAVSFPKHQHKWSPVSHCMHWPCILLKVTGKCKV
jgi:hypothetical protein